MGKDLTGREAMNKIVREHYPAAKLPEDLREGLDADAKVRVVVEVETPQGYGDSLFQLAVDPKPLPWENILEMRSKLLADGRASVSMEEAVARIRELRDEWDY
jgi:hypothetical protein